MCRLGGDELPRASVKALARSDTGLGFVDSSDRCRDGLVVFGSGQDEHRKLALEQRKPLRVLAFSVLHHRPEPTDLT